MVRGHSPQQRLHKARLHSLGLLLGQGVQLPLNLLPLCSQVGVGGGWGGRLVCIYLLLLCLLVGAVKSCSPQQHSRHSTPTTSPEQTTCPPTVGAGQLDAVKFQVAGCQVTLPPREDEPDGRQHLLRVQLQRDCSGWGEQAGGWVSGRGVSGRGMSGRVDCDLGKARVGQHVPGR